MRCWELTSFGTEGLRCAERPDPKPGPGQVLVRVRACSLNYRDLLVVRGQYNPKLPLPIVPLSDGAGVVEAVGEAVTRVRTGDRVAGLFAPGWQGGPPELGELRGTLGGPLGGMLAERVVLPETGVARVPAHMSDVEASTLPCAALTAWSALVELGPVRPGETVLVQGTGGVALFALQIAQMLGARVVVTSRHPTKLERAKQLGAWQTIDTSAEPDWGRRARELTAGAGVDHVVDLGGANTLAQSLRAVRPGGTVSVIGVLGGRQTELDVTAVLMNQVRLQGVFVGHRKGFEAMVRAFEAARLRPVIDRVFDWDQAPAAIDALGRGAHFGKLVVRVAED
ncbi:MAG: NAD(P)-dependent alcohol dehydrogenase [Myxococcota bacterium]|nr:NAD(P)-dependent alcohol dehydrogenase [Myxococcota bacterium]MDW8362779.1 NAD(P)-dependent alcohol dehydrogenase [Myxococcales bacterium]